MTLRIAHVSDSHGTLPEIPFDFDAIVHSGDFLPTKGRRMGERINARRETIYQRRWLDRKAGAIRAWPRGRPLYLCPGNHDFLHWDIVAAAMGGEVVSIDERIAELGGITLYGFPWIPWIEGEWRREARDPEMRELVAAIPEVDILVAHCPPHGVLDEEFGVHFGNAPLANEFAYARDRLPRVLLCGHVHASGGRVERWLDRVTVVNSATMVQLVEVEG